MKVMVCMCMHKLLVASMNTFSSNVTPIKLTFNYLSHFSGSLIFSYEHYVDSIPTNLFSSIYTFSTSSLKSVRRLVSHRIFKKYRSLFIALILHHLMNPIVQTPLIPKRKANPFNQQAEIPYS
jgi:hypothetical protein